MTRRLLALCSVLVFFAGCSSFAPQPPPAAPLRTIRLGQGMRPMGTAMASDGRTLFMSTGRTKMVLALDTTSNTVAHSVEAGARPWGIALQPDDKFLYTANGPSNDVSIIDTASMTVVGHVAAGTGPWGVAVIQQRP